MVPTPRLALRRVLLVLLINLLPLVLLLVQLLQAERNLLLTNVELLIVLVELMEVTASALLAQVPNTPRLALHLAQLLTMVTHLLRINALKSNAVLDQQELVVFARIVQFVNIKIKLDKSIAKHARMDSRQTIRSIHVKIVK